MLRGLTAEESEWLARKATRLGGLDMALRFLLREGLLGFLVTADETDDSRQASRAYANHVGRLARRAPGVEPLDAPPRETEEPT